MIRILEPSRAWIVASRSSAFVAGVTNLWNAIAMIFINIFIALYLLFAVFYDSPELNLIHRVIQRRISSLVRLFGLGHSWNMYSGPFLTITRLETRVSFGDCTTEIIRPQRRYEFRRHYFMMGIRTHKRSLDSYLDLLEKQLRESPKQYVRIEIIKRVSPSAVRVGGLMGKFEVPSKEDGFETLVAMRKGT